MADFVSPEARLLLLVCQKALSSPFALTRFCLSVCLSVCLPLPNPEPGVVSGHHPVCLSFRRSVEDIALHAE